MLLHKGEAVTLLRVQHLPTPSTPLSHRRLNQMELQESLQASSHSFPRSAVCYLVVHTHRNICKVWIFRQISVLME